MNLSHFLKEVDSTTGKLSAQELANLIHDIARTLPEAGRDEFLDKLNRIKEGNEVKKEQESKTSGGIEKKYKAIRDKLKNICEGELCLEASLNYEYDEWYNNDVDEFIFSDPEGVVSIIEEACGFVHQCVDCEQYSYGYEIACSLIGLEIDVQGEGWESWSDALSIEQLCQKLSDIDFRGFVVDGLHAAYCAHDMEKRPEALYEMIENSHQDSITLEMVMQNGDELPELDEFVTRWIAYLGEMTTPNSERMLKEALELTNNPERLLENARKYCKYHPGLYEQYLKMRLETASGERLFVIGKEALDAIDVKYIVRSRIANMMSVLALKQGAKEEAEKYWLEAFRSDTRVVNFLRLVVESGDYTVFHDEIWEINHKMRANVERRNGFTPRGEWTENTPDANTVYMLAFFEGEFRYVKEFGMTVKESLGWSSTFMKCGLAAFILLLTEQKYVQQGGREMCNRVISATRFDKEEYEQGTDKKVKEGNLEWFWKCFNVWKSGIALPDQEKQNYLAWIEKLLAKRVKGIMDGNRRNYYGECAAYIAALGEAVESWGERGAKQKLLLEYKALYSRRSAFHEELRAYGMVDAKRR